MPASQRHVHGRRAACTVALQALYEIDTTGHEPEDVMQRRITENSLAPDAAEYARELVNGVLQMSPISTN